MYNDDFEPYKFTEENFIKDYRKTMAILDDETLRTMKRIEEIRSRK